jgi:hypothetical protein
VLYCPECGNRTTHATLPCPWTLASNFSFSISLLPGSSICSRRAVSTCCLLVYDCCNFLASSLMVSACVTTISVSIVWSDRVGSTFSLSRSPFSFSSSSVSCSWMALALHFFDVLQYVPGSRLPRLSSFKISVSWINPCCFVLNAGTKQHTWHFHRN